MMTKYRISDCKRGLELCQNSSALSVSNQHVTTTHKQDKWASTMGCYLLEEVEQSVEGEISEQRM